MTKAKSADISTAAWLLQSILHAESVEEGASLRDVIAFADYINHAIFSFDEFSEALGAIREAGLITQEGNSLKTAAAFQAWYRENFKPGARPAYAHERQMLTEYLSPLLRKNHPVKACISKEAFRSAVDEYLPKGN